MKSAVARTRVSQKYYRVMTRDGDREARIVVLLPRDLPEPPVLPFELFGASTRYACGVLLGEPLPNRADPRPVITDGAPVEGVTWAEAGWASGEVRVRCQGHGHATLNHEGDEVEELALRVEVTGLPRDARLLLSGPIGELDAFKVEGEDDGAIEDRWRALEGLPPRPRKRRSRRPRSRQRW